MSFDLKTTFLLGWPVLSILLIFSIMTLAILLQCHVTLKRLRIVIKGPGASPAARDQFDLVEKRLAILGTIANASPFVGLLGTVLGIIRAFHSISANSGAGLMTVAGGISEALVSTAAGLAVAIPASMMYNYFTYHHQKLEKTAGL